MSYCEGFSKGYKAGFNKACKFIDELEAQIANLVIDKGALEDKLRDTEKVLYSLVVGNGIPPGFGVEYDYDTYRCKVYPRTRHVRCKSHVFAPDLRDKEYVFTKAELLEAIDNIQKDSVT